MSSQSSRSKLEHAFQLAYDRLNIDKLLDWQGNLLHVFVQRKNVLAKIMHITWQDDIHVLF